MLVTDLTELLDIRLPLIAAPMAGVSGPKLAVACSEAGALGTIAIGSTAKTEAVLNDINAVRSSGKPFGIGLMAWSLESRPELLEIAIDASPVLISISFGDFEPYIETVKRRGILATTQVGNLNEFHRALEVDVDFIVARGAEAGGHGINEVSTFELLQEVLQDAHLPVVAAGGITSGRGLAAAIAAGAAGAWVGTALIASEESLTNPAARQKIIEANANDTIYTSVFDIVQGIAWPKKFGGRALRNSFTDRWHNFENNLMDNAGAKLEYTNAIANLNYDIALIYAGQGVGLVNEIKPAGTILESMALEAEYLLSRSLDREK